ncbi:hypothetical protein J3R82DRAFT_1782 [Butyriboletus roseoflavus]|nr:hypothetical protein J3R82DRAFT_1782 [Butyriboletus roseoflavus]
MLAWSYSLHQPINLFIKSADKLFGPIMTIWRNGRVKKCIPWTTFLLRARDWEIINDTHAIISEANKIQQYFSSEQHTLFGVRSLCLRSYRVHGSRRELTQSTNGIVLPSIVVSRRLENTT